MDEIALLMEKMHAREQPGNRVIVFAATMFLTSSLAYSLYQFSDVNSAFSASLPSPFTVFEYSTARTILCKLARFDLLPVDFGSEDPYMIRIIYGGKKHPKTRPLRVCIPVGLAAGIDLDSEGPASLTKVGFGSVEVGNVTIDPSLSNQVDSVQLLSNSIVAPLTRLDGSQGLEVVAKRLCDYLEYRNEDLLARNTITGISIAIESVEDVVRVFQHSRLIALADYISLDVSKISDASDITKIIDRINVCGSKHESVPLILLKVALSQSFPPNNDVVEALKESEFVAGVNINGTGVASGKNERITKFVSDTDISVHGLLVREKSTEAVSEWYKALGMGECGKEIFASGGVYSGRDALEKIEAGASLVNVFSAFVHDGPTVARRIKTQLSVQLMNKGYYLIDEAIGVKHRGLSKRLKDSQKRRQRF